MTPWIIAGILALVVIWMVIKNGYKKCTEPDYEKLYNREMERQQLQDAVKQPEAYPYIVYDFVRINNGCEVRIRNKHWKTGPVDQEVLYEGNKLYVRDVKSKMVDVYLVEYQDMPTERWCGSYYVPKKASQGYDKFGRKKRNP